MGRDRRDFVFQWELKPGQAIRKQNAIVVTTYSTLRDYDGPTETYPRVEQIFNWAGPDFQGIMAFDESQEMRNAAGQEDVSGKRSEEHTSEFQSLIRISYAVFCLKKKKNKRMKKYTKKKIRIIRK